MDWTEEYMDFCIYKLNKNTHKKRFDYMLNGALGMAGEAGEIADEIKKHLFQEHELNEEKLFKEAGDVFFYLNVLLYSMGKTLKEVAEANMDKLNKRYKGSATKEESINRKD